MKMFLKHGMDGQCGDDVDTIVRDVNFELSPRVREKCYVTGELPQIQSD